MTVIATAVIVAAVALITLASASGKTEEPAAGVPLKFPRVTTSVRYWFKPVPAPVP